MIAHAEPIAHHFAKSGLIVVVVEPAPVGVRVDGRFAYDGSDERAIMVSACLDLSLVGLFVLGALGGVATN